MVDDLDAPTFDSAELQANRRRQQQLIELICSKEALVVVGAGSSVGAGYPTWEQLLKCIEALAHTLGVPFSPDPDARKREPLEYAHQLKQQLLRHTGTPNQYYKCLSSTFAERAVGHAQLHLRLVQLPFKGIVTTNYDPLLESALRVLEPNHGHNNWLVVGPTAAQYVSEFLLSLDSKPRFHRRVAHLHGRFDEPQQIILTAEDYAKAYGLSLPGAVDDGAWTLHRKLLWAILATRRVVFIGFSLTDPYFELMLETVAKDLWRWGDPVHYAVLPIHPWDASETKDRALALSNRYGIEVVFYEDLDRSHRGLLELTDEIAVACGLTTTSSWLDRANRNMSEALRRRAD